jgi:hypothetical protein
VDCWEETADADEEESPDEDAPELALVLELEDELDEALHTGTDDGVSTAYNGFAVQLCSPYWGLNMKVFSPLQLKGPEGL